MRITSSPAFLHHTHAEPTEKFAVASFSIIYPRAQTTVLSKPHFLPLQREFFKHRKARAAATVIEQQIDRNNKRFISQLPFPPPQTGIIKPQKTDFVPSIFHFVN